MLSHDVTVADEVVLFDGDRAQVVVDGAQYLREATAALGTGRVVDHVLGHEVVEDRTPTRALAPEQFLDYLTCAPPAHLDSMSPPGGERLPVADPATGTSRV